MHEISFKQALNLGIAFGFGFVWGQLLFGLVWKTLVFMLSQ